MRFKRYFLALMMVAFHALALTAGEVWTAKNVPDPGIPESFKVLVKELQSIGLDIKVLNEDEEEVSLRDDEDDDIATTAREVDLDINGQVVENAPEKPVDDYADNDATEDDSDSGDIIADMGNFTITDNPDGDLDDPTNM